MSEITPEELGRRLQADGEDVLVLDIRHREEFEDWHVPGSRNVDDAGAARETLAVGDVEVEVIHTLGHSEGSVSFDVGGEALLTGDTRFHESVGRVELSAEAGIEDTDVEDNAATLYESLQRLLAYPDDVVVLPAHDPGSPDPPVVATLGEVRARNADLGRDREDFVETLASDLPDHPPNFERVKRANVGQASVSESEVADLELGPNNCAAE